MNRYKKEQPRLSEIKKENPFGTPANYFDDFPARLQAKIDAENKVVPPAKKNRFIQSIKPALGLAASFALIALLVYWPVKMYLTNEVVENAPQNNSYEEEFSSMVIENIDENSFFALLEEPDNGIEFSEEDLLSYVSTNLSEYELYTETEK